jgi:methanogenic corrinoid protein MtbC1
MQELDLCQELTDPPARPDGGGEIRDVSARMVTSRHWKMALERVIENQILPRLLLSHASDDRTATPTARRATPTTDEFVALLLGQDTENGLAHMEDLRAGGLSMDAILLDHLAPAARRLGEFWESDRCDFIEVSVGLRRLQFILQMLTPTQPETRHDQRPAGSILLLPTPGETHVFGLSILTRFFQSDGWRVQQASERDFLDALAGERFDVVGFSLGCARLSANLTSAIARARATSRNSSIQVLVGGALFASQPDLARTVGADAAAVDARQALNLAQSLLNRQLAV